LPYTELLKPTIIAVVFAVSGELLSVATMPVVVVFCLSFFVNDLANELVPLYFAWPHGDAASTAGRYFEFFWVASMMSAISLWAPLLCGMVAFALTRTIRRGKPPKQPGWGR